MTHELFASGHWMQTSMLSVMEKFGLNGAAQAAEGVKD
jgi:hypothetical protein